MKTFPLIFLFALLNVTSGFGAQQELKALSCEIPVGGREKLTPIADEIRAESPDVLLVQSASGWGPCSALAELLKPETYHLLTCSSFGKGEGARVPREVAILAKDKGSYAWTERVGTNFPAAGFALAVISLGTQRVAVVSAQLGRSTQSVEVAKSVVKQIELLSGWRTNRPTAFLLMSSGRNPGRRAQADFQRALAQTGLVRAEQIPDDRFAYAYPSAVAGAEVTTTNHGFFAVRFIPGKAMPLSIAAEKGVAARPSNKKRVSKPVGETSLANQTPADAPVAQQVTIAAPVAARPEIVPPHVVAPVSESQSAQSRAGHVSKGLWVAVSGVGIALLAVLFRAKRRAHRKPRASQPKLIAEHVGTAQVPYVVVAPASTTASGNESAPPAFSAKVIQAEDPELIRTKSAAAMEPFCNQAGDGQNAAGGGLVEWLKGEFVRRIVSDRSSLMDSQAGAVVQAEEATRRLARIERRIRDQSESYARRISELEKELGAAREENRELIRSRIAQVRADMEAARSRLLSQPEE